jgi:hypothetical protein
MTLAGFSHRQSHMIEKLTLEIQFPLTHYNMWDTVSMREPPLRKTWEYSNITQPLMSYERGWPLACLEDLIKPNQPSHQGAR